MWSQNVVNISVICSYTGEWICPKMQQNEERNLFIYFSTGSSNRMVHLQDVFPTNFSIFFSYIAVDYHGFHCNGSRSQNPCGTRFPAKK